MIKIDKNSWHYKFIDKVDTVHCHETNLCPYIRQLIKCMLVSIACVIGCMLMALVALFFLAVPIMSSVSGISPALAIIASILYLVVGWCALITYRDTYIKVSWDKVLFTTTSKRNIEPNILSAWLTAKHKKVCPPVTFVNNE